MFSKMNHNVVLKLAYSFLAVIFCCVPHQVSVFAQQPAAGESTALRVFMKLDQGTNDLHAVLMALKISEGLVDKGAKVTLFLNLEGVRIADVRQPLDLSWGMGGGHSALHLYEQFVQKGGVVLVCPMCAKNAGLDQKNLRKGAKIADSINEITEAVLKADKVIGY